MKQMKKRILICLVLVSLSLLLSLGVSAEGMPRLYDGADLLSSGEEALLLSRLNRVSEAYGMDVAVVTVESTEGKSPMAFADDYYDANFGADGIILLISMEYRDWWISTAGRCIGIFDDYRIESIGENAAGYLGRGDNFDAFDAFVNDCDYYMYGELNGYPFDFGKAILIALGVGLLAAFIVTGALKSELKTVKAAASAADYTKPGSLNITASNDFFLYRNVRRIAKQTSSSGGGRTHTSSSGRSHGGGGGRF